MSFVKNDISMVRRAHHAFVGTIEITNYSKNELLTKLTILGSSIITSISMNDDSFSQKVSVDPLNF